MTAAIISIYDTAKLSMNYICFKDWTSQKSQTSLVNRNKNIEIWNQVTGLARCLNFVVINKLMLDQEPVGDHPGIPGKHMKVILQNDTILFYV